jgi:hypothetical protein
MASRRLLETQSKLLEAVDNGWIMVDGHGPIYSHLFFQVLHQLSRLLCIGKHVHILKECVQQESGICGLFDIHLPTNCHLESLGVQDRAVLTEAAYWLLDGYPDRLVNIFRLCGIGKTELTYHLPQIPFWFNCALDQLDRSYYTISTDEVSNAVSFMGRNDSRISNVGLNRVLGRGKRTKTIMKLVGS